MLDAKKDKLRNKILEIDSRNSKEYVDNWYALLACIANSKLSISKSVKLLSQDK